MIISVLAVLLFTALTSCGAYPKKVGAIGPSGEQLTWSEMDFAQRKDHMRRAVLPLASKVFKSWRPQRFATIDCSLCHAQAKQQMEFAMPTAHLPRLSGELLLGPEFESEPDTTRLKLDQLVPGMSEALGLKPFSIVTRRGFGCYSCHLGPKGPMFGN